MDKGKLKRRIAYFFASFLFIVLFLENRLYAEASKPSDWVKTKCREWQETRCKAECRQNDAGLVKECWVDPKYFVNATWRNCYALHLAYTCAPCRDFFATNYGGAFREVSCEYFYNALEVKNKKCDNCLNLITHFNYSEEELPFKLR